MSYRLKIVAIVSMPFQEVTYIVGRPERTDCLVIDPGFEPGKIVSALQKHGLTPAAFLITHGHSDHIAGIGALKERWPECPIVIGINEADKLINPARNLSAQYGIPLTSPPADRLVRDGETIEYAGFKLEVREIPGHSSGHVVFIWRENDPPVVFGGDVLFAGGIGRTDFPDGSFERLAEGIREHLFTLPDNTIVLSGHGSATTVGQEKQTNPFVGEG